MNCLLTKERKIHCIFELFSAGHNPHECVEGLNVYSLGHLIVRSLSDTVFFIDVRATFVCSCASQPLFFCQRCCVEAVDQQGATALHVAAERGAVEVCWTLLQRTGCRMLHEKNHSGLTPLELSKQGKAFR